MSSLPEQLEGARTLLFVPGNRPERFSKAVASGADLVIVDLEDAVPAGDKVAARQATVAWLAAGNACAVRVNARGTDWHEDDVAALVGHGCVVVVPKAEEAGALDQLGSRLTPAACLMALVETAKGVLATAAIASVPAVRRLAFGSFDLAAELGVAPDDPLAMASSRGALALASAAAGIVPPVDGVSDDVADSDTLRRDVDHARRLGFSGKLCIHPRQVAVVHQALRPSDVEVAWAQAVVQGAGPGGGVAVVAGRMVDRPVVRRAHRILAAARSTATHDQDATAGEL
ncbi:MAG TPA: CoA ester lyase [Streptosporangiaceae bacterium]|nr:CoA ester lyase [Streptosporangiaceae bacterium]